MGNRYPGETPPFNRAEVSTWLTTAHTDPDHPLSCSWAQAAGVDSDDFTADDDFGDSMAQLFDEASHGPMWLGSNVVKATAHVIDGIRVATRPLTKADLTGDGEQTGVQLALDVLAVMHEHALKLLTDYTAAPSLAGAR